MNIEVPIASVIVLEDRAAITRRAKVTVVAGQQQLVIERVSPVVADKTLTALASAGRVLDVRCERAMAPWRDPAAGSTELVAQLRTERLRLEAIVDSARARARAARSEGAAIEQLIAVGLRELAVNATRGVAVAGAAAELAELDVLDAAARARRVEAELAGADATVALQRLAARIATAEDVAGEQTAKLVIDLVADEPCELELTIGYVVPGAAWRPYHRATLDRTSGRIDWQTTACVWQATGEDWADADLTFSLERPSLGVAPPDLADDELHARRRPDTVTVEAREHEEQTTGLGGGPAQVPGIDDGGLGLRFTAARTTIRCDGRPHRVPAAGFTAQAELALVAIPLRSSWVHIRARVSNTGTLPLLAGPVDLIMASGYVGRAEVGFVALGEKFDVGFGPEADLRVHRTETRERDEAGLLGGWNVQTTKVAVRVSNLGAIKRDLVITERVPVSEVEQVEVRIAAPESYLLAETDAKQITARDVDERGLVTWNVELPPLGRRAVTLEYRVRSQRNVAGM